MSFQIPHIPSEIGLHLMTLVVRSAVKTFSFSLGGSTERRRCRIKPLMAAVFFVACVPLPTRAENWPQFRGPDGNGIANETIAIEWGVDRNLA
jgi:hypothetical protein